jgi:hypothetical protein
MLGRVSVVTLRQLSAHKSTPASRPCPPSATLFRQSIANRIPLYTRNPKDFTGLDPVLSVVSV